MTYHWSTHQLTEYLVSVSAPGAADGAMRVAVERAIESLEAEVGAVIIDGRVRASVGFGARGVPPDFVTGVIGGVETIETPGGRLYLATGALARHGTFSPSADRMVVGRLAEGHTAEETQLLHAMALVLGLVLHNLDTLQTERSRHRLVQTLLAIQRSISTRRPLDELLGYVTEGASSLLGGCPVALLLLDRATPGALIPASVHDFAELDEVTLAVVERAMSGLGVLVEPDIAGPLVAEAELDGGHRLIAERVLVNGEVTGCLVARVPPEDQSGAEHTELLSAFAQQVSLILTDAQTLDAVREAHHDPITGLPNRALFLQRLEREGRAARAQGRELTVLFIDLDRFKAVNDTLGHPAGDELLGQVASRIATSIRSEDVAARLGGDEFSVLLHAGVDAARGLAQRIIETLTRAFSITGREVFIGASVGIAPLHDQHRTASAVLSDADVAMYCAKRAGRGRWVVFEPYMLDDVANRLSLRTDLEHAQESAQLWLAYQPLVRLDTGRVHGVEALMRWNHPERGLVMPGDFIPIAEETQMILGIGAWAFEQGLAQVAGWRLGSPGLGLNLNVSVRQLVDPDLPARVRAALERNDVPPEALTLEITESILMEDRELARERLTALKRIGLRLAIDDFGTGYSSLSYVRRLPVDIVKIDRSFITGLSAQSRDDIAVVRSVLTLCQSLRLETVAEGIERPEQLAILTDLGCDLGQGYLFARPMAPQAWPAYAAHAPVA